MTQEQDGENVKTSKLKNIWVVILFVIALAVAFSPGGRRPMIDKCINCGFDAGFHQVDTERCPLNENSDMTGHFIETTFLSIDAHSGLGAYLRKLEERIEKLEAETIKE